MLDLSIIDFVLSENHLSRPLSRVIVASTATTKAGNAETKPNKVINLICKLAPAMFFCLAINICENLLIINKTIIAIKTVFAAKSRKITVLEGMKTCPVNINQVEDIRKIANNNMAILNKTSP